MSDVFGCEEESCWNLRQVLRRRMQYLFSIWLLFWINRDTELIARFFHWPRSERWLLSFHSNLDDDKIFSLIIGLDIWCFKDNLCFYTKQKRKTKVYERKKKGKMLDNVWRDIIIFVLFNVSLVPISFYIYVLSVTDENCLNYHWPLYILFTSMVA